MTQRCECGYVATCCDSSRRFTEECEKAVAEMVHGFEDLMKRVESGEADRKSAIEYLNNVYYMWEGIKNRRKAERDKELSLYGNRCADCGNLTAPSTKWCVKCEKKGPQRTFFDKPDGYDETRGHTKTEDERPSGVAERKKR